METNRSGGAVFTAEGPDIGDDLGAAVEGLDLPAALERIHRSFDPGRLAVVSNFGPSTLIVLHTIPIRGAPSETAPAL